MITTYDISTKDKVEISYSTFILANLLKLGLNLSNKGTFYLRDMIIIAVQVNKLSESDISLKCLLEKLSKLKNISPKTIKSNIDYAFKYIDILKAEKNFKNIFGFEYDRYYITTKSIICLMIGQIYNIKKEEE